VNNKEEVIFHCRCARRNSKNKKCSTRIAEKHEIGANNTSMIDSQVGLLELFGPLGVVSLQLTGPLTLSKKIDQLRFSAAAAENS
jgi:hypothetical protein